MQAIARVNRVFRDKPGGLVVDYIGVGHSPKEAAKKFTADGFGEPTEDLDDAAKAQFLDALDAIRKLLPADVSIANWRALSNIAFEDLCAKLYGYYIETDERRDYFLAAEKRVSAAYSLVKHLDDLKPYTEEVAFYQLMRGELNKTIPAGKTAAERDQAVRDLVDRTLRVASQGIVDIFTRQGSRNPISRFSTNAFCRNSNRKSLRTCV